MKQLTLIILLLSAFQLSAQIDINVEVLGATTSTTCPDATPAVLFEVNVEGQGWETYPELGNCFTALPNVQYSENYICQSDVPAQVELCFRVFNNPLFPLGCLITRTCQAQICQMVDIPAAGVSDTLTMTVTGDSEGELSFAITNDGFQDNDLPCEAIDLGLLARGDTLGDNTQDVYSNLCGTNQNEPNPADDGAFDNNNGVWFEFTTGPDVGSLMYIQGLSDPENNGNFLDIEIAVYESDNGACDGNLILSSWTAPFNTNDATLRFSCPQPNTTYYVLIDGAFSTPNSEEGFFGLQVVNVDVDDAPDLKCDAMDLGAVPEGGSIGLDEQMANFCATGAGDPFSPSFVTQTSVWFKFQAPPSGHVIIDAISDREIDSIGIQLSLYRPFQGNCNFFFQHLGSSYTFEDLDESLQVSCLFAGEDYYILLDGDGGNGRGIFDLTVTDAGDITPITVQDTTICAGDTYSIGTSSYTETGLYADTFQLFLGCDSIVRTNLTVLAPLSITINQTSPAIGEGGPNGVAEVSATGGAGNYTFEWCDGSTGTTNNMLVGGSTCCVSVMDDFGCVGDTCFVVEFVTGIIPSFTADTLDCNGDEDGLITFSVVSGLPPYTYSWQNSDNSINGNGTIMAESELVSLPGLPAGLFTITVQDVAFDTTFSVEILEPTPLEVDITQQEDASCFSVCDGTLAVIASGGVGGYTYNWSNGEDTSAVNGLCAQIYTVSVMDSNACLNTLELEVEEPEEFIAIVEEQSPVSCFGDSDGVITVSTNGNPISYSWDTGDMTATVSGLPAGDYSVEVVNEDGCTDTAMGILSEPDAPVSVSIEEIQVIDCIGNATGVLSAIPAGPGDTFTVSWSNGASGELLENVGAGMYTATITNENGCTAAADYLLTEPDIIQALTSAIDITCISGENGGIIRFDTTFGGTPPYQYSLDGVIYTGSPTLPGISAGSYEVVVQDAAGCEQSFTQSVQPPPSFSVEIVSDETTITLGDSILLNAQTGNDNTVYTWSVPDSLVKEFTGQAIFASPLVTTAYYVEAFDTVSLCTANDFVIVKVEKQRNVYIPNAFSPNDDGRNDFFGINTGVGVSRIQSLRIFSRTGNLVYEATDFMPNDRSVEWDGSFRGEELDPGVFVYVAEIEFVDGAVEVFQGDVTLLK
jgi:gliding motility-associated-like protein